MILTVTVNAAVDKTLTVANFQLGHRHRAQQGLIVPGGKGINVARTLKRLGDPVIATGLAGGGSSFRPSETIAAGLIDGPSRYWEARRKTSGRQPALLPSGYCIC